MSSAPSEKFPRNLKQPKLPMAQWGTACTACASAKVKCIRSKEEPGAKCHRCERLMKECAVQIHRPRKKRRVEPSRTNQIEERLNTPINLIEQPEEPAVGSQSAGDSSYDSTASTTTSIQSPTAQGTITKNFNAYAPLACMCRPESCAAPRPPDSDEALLDFYQRELQPVHPFVIIPADVTATEVHETRPFLMSAIRMVATFRSHRSMRSQMHYLMQHIADHMLVGSEKSLDLLLGIIVVIGWYQYHCCIHTHLNSLIALAVTLVDEMRLSCHPSVPERTSLMVSMPQEPASRTNEERRAFAAVWFLSSATSLTVKKSNPMRYTYYLQECVKHLESAQEYKTDTALVFLIRIQHLTNRVADFNCKDKATEEVSSLPTAPASAYVSAFQNEIDRLRDNLSPEIRKNKIYQMYLYSATLRLYELPIAGTALVVPMFESLTSNTTGTGTPLDQIYQSSAALTIWFDNWLAVHATKYRYLTTSVASQIGYAITMLECWAKLATPMSADLSADYLNVTASNVDCFSHKTIDTSSATTSGSYFTAYKDCGISQVSSEPPDPYRPAAVATLQSQLLTQSGLTVNIAEILTAICARFEKASAAIKIASVESGKVEGNVWSMAAQRVRIAKTKLERWMELVSAGETAPNLEHKPDAMVYKEAWRYAPQQPQQQQSDAAMFGDDTSGVVVGGNNIDMEMNVFPSTIPCTSDLLAGVDPIVWFDGYFHQSW